MAKKILFCVTNDLNTDQRMIRICSSLAANGFDVKLIGRRLPGSAPVTARLYKQFRMNCFFTKGKMFYIEYNLRLFVHLISHKSDAICAVDLDTLLPAFLASKFRNKICIYDAHEYFTEVPEVIRRPLVKKIWESLANILIPRVKYHYTVGDALAAELSNRYGVEFQVIRNVSSRKKNVQVAAVSDINQPFILYQGAMNEGRGIHLAIESMHYLDGLILVLVGDGDLVVELKKLTKQLNLEHKVKFLGKISPEQLAELTPKAKLGIHLLENKGLSYYFSLANRTFDYMEAGVPAIHPDFPEYQGILSEYKIGELLKSYEPQQIARQIKNMLSDETYYKLMKNECVRASEEYSWEREEQKLVEIYRKFGL